MIPRIAAFIAAALLLSACSDQDWSHALTYVGVNHSNAAPAAPAQPRPVAQRPADQPAPAPVQAAAAQAPNQFCESVASQDAQSNDFDPPTQRRVFVQSYQQCVTVFGDVTK
ncbi:MAG TPA: hypothetical protein VGP01_05405 [Rhizomicrobium sp.]|jgi:hypothetical protein|nr:hypothetical protein [Rhizomicrobium sp.]